MDTVKVRTHVKIFCEFRQRLDFMFYFEFLKDFLEN